ncbi:MAG TPA: GreA/GreB family elongation factor [Polyangiaceae bacterium]|nr:GreA/GreB family elongation factor [Polyangiaceae bacterium]
MARKLDKQALLDLFKKELEAQLERANERARDAAAGATHEENRAEGDKDMRATEASYIARGHGERVLQLEQAVTRLNTLPLRAFKAGDPIAQGAVVCLAGAPGESQAQRHYFLIPVAGGQRITLSGVEYQALTTQSPLGAALLGLSQGDEVEVTTPQGPRTSVIVSVG